MIYADKLAYEYRNKKGFIHRRIETYNALKEVSFKIEEGEIVAFLGRNGAGKSTLIKILTGLLHPSGGTLSIKNYDIKNNRYSYLKDIGVVFGQRTQLWWELPVIDSLRLLKEIYGISEEDYKKRLALYDKYVDVDNILKKQVKSLSLGQRMLCEVLAAFLHEPSIVFLDEPTIGLDSSVKDDIRKFILDFNREYNTTIIMTTHDSIDIQSLADRVIMLDYGEIIYDGSLNRFMECYGGNKLLYLKFGANCNVKEIFEIIKSKSNYEVEEVNAQELVVKIGPCLNDTTHFLNDIEETINEVECDITIREKNLDSILASIYKDRWHI